MIVYIYIFIEFDMTIHVICVILILFHKLQMWTCLHRHFLVNLGSDQAGKPQLMEDCSFLSLITGGYL